MRAETVVVGPVWKAFSWLIDTNASDRKDAAWSIRTAEAREARGEAREARGRAVEGGRRRVLRPQAHMGIAKV